jgi:hypothetical protein
MQEQKTPGRMGRPRRGKGTRHVDLTLTIEVIEALESITTNKSRFIDDLLRQEPQICGVIASQKP